VGRALTRRTNLLLGRSEFPFAIANVPLPASALDLRATPSISSRHAAGLGRSLTGRVRGASTDGGENTHSTPARPLFVGRERELLELRSGLADATSGRGRLGGVFLISGEPGIGKTRLADEIASDAASSGMRVVWGRCWEGGGAPAYLPWVDVLRSLILHEPRERERHSALPAEIAQLIPELSPETVSPRVPSDPQQARFSAV
jgi:hypothetical protein